MGARHTPGPWRAGKTAEGSVVVQRGKEVGFRVIGTYIENEMADALVIAAAPDLLAIAREYRRAVEYYIRIDERKGNLEGAALKGITLAMIDAVITKATGT